MTRTPLFALTLALAGAACTHRGAATPSTPQASTAATPSQDMDAMCPMNVPGTKVSAEDTATGAAFTFTTTPDQVQALRDRVAAMAEMHNRHHAAMGEHGSMQGSAGASGMQGDAQGSAGAGMHGSMHGGAGTEGGAEGMGMPVAARASAEDVDGGARLVLTPNDPADLPKLQSMVRAHAEHMEQSGCPMMHGKHGA